LLRNFATTFIFFFKSFCFAQVRMNFFTILCIWFITQFRNSLLGDFEILLFFSPLLVPLKPSRAKTFFRNYDIEKTCFFYHKMGNVTYTNLKLSRKLSDCSHYETLLKTLRWERYFNSCHNKMMTSTSASNFRRKFTGCVSVQKYSNGISDIVFVTYD